MTVICTGAYPVAGAVTVVPVITLRPSKVIQVYHGMIHRSILRIREGFSAPIADRPQLLFCSSPERIEECMRLKRIRQ